MDYRTGQPVSSRISASFGQIAHGFRNAHGIPDVRRTPFKTPGLRPEDVTTASRNSLGLRGTR